jgi:hypothetical protein
MLSKNSVTAYQTTPCHTSTINPDAFVVGIFGKMDNEFVGRNKIYVIAVDFIGGIDSPAVL